MPDASVPSPLVWGSSRGVVLGTHTYMCHFNVVMNYIHVFEQCYFLNSLEESEVWYIST